MKITRIIRTTLLPLILVGLGSTQSVEAQAELGIVTREGAHIYGVVEGPLQVLAEDGEVILESSARIWGNLTLPRAKVGLKAGPDAEKGQGATGISERFTVVDKGEDKPARGARRTSVSFEVIPVDSPRMAAGREAIVEEERALTEGSYGNLSTQNGRLILGTAGRTTRYDFQSLVMSGKSEIQLQGPVVIHVAGDVVIQGKAGMPGRPHWLDIRMAGGTLRIAETAQVHAFINAPRVPVVVEKAAELFGGVLCSRIDLLAGARVVAIRPDWTTRSAASSGPGPLFVHKMLRVQSRVAELRESLPEQYQLDLAYASEEPVLTITQTFYPQHRLAQQEEYEVFFSAARALLEETGFSEAQIAMTRHGGAKTPGGEIIRLTLARESIEDTFWALTREPEMKSAILKVREDPLLQQLFMMRCASFSNAVWAKINSSVR